MIERFAMLTMVTESNNNKFYKMEANNDNTFTAIYGRIGNQGAIAVYPMSKWDSKYREKINKGYKDQTSLFCEMTTVEQEIDNCKNDNKKSSVINSLISYLSVFAHSFIRKNYKMDFSRITYSMITAANNKLRELNDLAIDQNTHIKEFNEKLLDLFMTLPRTMFDTRAYLAHSQKDFIQICEHEKYLLEQISGSVVSMKDDKNEMLKDEGISKKFKLKAWKCTDSQLNEIKKMMGSNSHKLKNAWRVENDIQRTAFDKYVEANDIKDVKKLWHGSRNENWLNILCSGLLLNPSAIKTGSMFGHGIYFSHDFDKSAGYTSIENSRWANGNDRTAFLAIMDVAYGQALDVYSYSNDYSNYNERKINSLNKNSLHAHCNNGMLRKDEIVVYNEKASTIRYLVEIEN